MIDHSWVPWFRELVQKIVAGEPSDLAEKAAEVDWLKDAPMILAYGDQNIDPFSFIYTLASQMGDEKFMRRLGSVRDVFDVEAAFPEQRPYIPTPNAINTLFHDEGRGNPDLLWELFRAAVVDAPEVSGSLFDGALEIRQVAMAKLTQALFIINPDTFFPADNTLGSFVATQAEFDGMPGNYREYEACVMALRACFPGCAPYEINTFLYAQTEQRLITDRTSYFQVSTKVDGEGARTTGLSLRARTAFGPDTVGQRVGTIPWAIPRPETSC